jgi:hypothetical protein
MQEYLMFGKITYHEAPHYAKISIYMAPQEPVLVPLPPNMTGQFSHPHKTTEKV